VERLVPQDNDLPETFLGGVFAMIRKLVYCIWLGGVLVIGSQLTARSVHPQSEMAKQSKPATRSVKGKIISIADTGTSFAVELEGTNNETMEFLLNNRTQVQGKVKIGMLVAVDYEPIEEGQNLALNIAART
jgi:hypothetical protein